MTTAGLSKQGWALFAAVVLMNLAVVDVSMRTAPLLLAGAWAWARLWTGDRPPMAVVSKGGQSDAPA